MLDSHYRVVIYEVKKMDEGKENTGNVEEKEADKKSYIADLRAALSKHKIAVGLIGAGLTGIAAGVLVGNYSTNKADNNIFQYDELVTNFLTEQDIALNKSQNMYNEAKKTDELFKKKLIDYDPSVTSSAGIVVIAPAVAHTDSNGNKVIDERTIGGKLYIPISDAIYEINGTEMAVLIAEGSNTSKVAEELLDWEESLKKMNETLHDILEINYGDELQSLAEQNKEIERILNGELLEEDRQEIEDLGKEVKETILNVRQEIQLNNQYIVILKDALSQLEKLKKDSMEEIVSVSVNETKAERAPLSGGPADVDPNKYHGVNINPVPGAEGTTSSNYSEYIDENGRFVQHLEWDMKGVKSVEFN